MNLRQAAARKANPSSPTISSGVCANAASTKTNELASTSMLAFVERLIFTADASGWDAVSGGQAKL
jgi:hypothetical protein